MIKIEKVEVLGWEAAIRGMRNPMESHHLSDSGSCVSNQAIEEGWFDIGSNDHNLMMRLRNAGTDHRKYMRFITVFLDITAPMYWWKEFDTYKVGTVRNSCSTMHKIHAREFTLEDFSCEHLSPASINNLYTTIVLLNHYRYFFVNWDKIDENSKNKAALFDKKDAWWQMIQLLSSSYNQKATIKLNYEVLANMYRSRKNHKLDEWRDFCKWIESLPYSEIITGPRPSEEPEDF